MYQKSTHKSARFFLAILVIYMLCFSTVTATLDVKIGQFKDSLNVLKEKLILLAQKQTEVKANLTGGELPPNLDDLDNLTSKTTPLIDIMAAVNKLTKTKLTELNEAFDLKNLTDKGKVQLETLKKTNAKLQEGITKIKTEIQTAQNVKTSGKSLNDTEKELTQINTSKEVIILDYLAKPNPTSIPLALEVGDTYKEKLDNLNAAINKNDLTSLKTIETKLNEIDTIEQKLKEIVNIQKIGNLAITANTTDNIFSQEIKELEDLKQSLNDHIKTLKKLKVLSDGIKLHILFHIFDKKKLLTEWATDETKDEYKNYNFTTNKPTNKLKVIAICKRLTDIHNFIKAEENDLLKEEYSLKLEKLLNEQIYSTKKILVTEAPIKIIDALFDPKTGTCTTDFTKQIIEKINPDWNNVIAGQEERKIPKDKIKNIRDKQQILDRKIIATQRKIQLLIAKCDQAKNLLTNSKATIRKLILDTKSAQEIKNLLILFESCQDKALKEKQQLNDFQNKLSIIGVFLYGLCKEFGATSGALQLLQDSAQAPPIIMFFNHFCETKFPTDKKKIIDNIDKRLQGTTPKEQPNLMDMLKQTMLKKTI